MMRTFWTNLYIALLLAVSLLFTTGGCERVGMAQTEESEALPEFRVTPAIEKTVTDFADFVGFTESIHNVDIVARVKGFLRERLFEEGSDVRQGQLLYVIEPEQYQASVDLNRASLEKDEALAVDARLEAERFEALFERNSTSESERDSYVARGKAAQAQVELDKAALRESEITLGYCTVYSPIDGRIGRTLIHADNLVGNDGDTLLTTVVQLDPIYIKFSPPASMLPYIAKRIADGPPLEVTITLSDGAEYPIRGKVKFYNNTVDRSTATILLRATIDNPEHRLLPDDYVQVRLWTDEIKDAIFVPEGVVQQRQVGDVVMVVGQDGMVEMRKVELGKTFGRLQLIRSGLKPGELVVTEKITQVRAGMKIKPIVTPWKDPKEMSDATTEMPEADDGRTPEFPKPYPVPASENESNVSTSPKEE